jgi:hypothetical protein
MDKKVDIEKVIEAKKSKHISSALIGRSFCIAEQV